jgi:ATP-dependent phosphofructokinase / diphosphate-dependent phosphofructokinase
MAKKIALLTGGGDSSAINDLIRALVILLKKENHEITGIRNSYKGLIDGDFLDLDLGKVRSINYTGGTIIGTSRTNPYKMDGALEKIFKTIKANKIDVLVCIGGNDTLTVASKLSTDGIKVIGVPQTIDNDICGTDYSIGFHSSVSNIVKSVMMMMSSVKSHQREMFVEVMGRDSGFLSIGAAFALGADRVLIPEYPVDIDMLADYIKRKRDAGKAYGLYLISEGVSITGAKLLENTVDCFGNIKLGGISYSIADAVEKKIGLRPNVSILGYTQRGGEPAPYDSYLSTLFAKGVYKNIIEKRYGYMVGVINEKPANIKLKDAIGSLKRVDRSSYEFINSLGDIL